MSVIFGILGGVPFTPLVVLWVNFLVQVPIAIALGFDKASPGLMERKPRPLTQPVLSGPQWVRLIFTGFLVAVGTLFVETYYSQAVSPALAGTMGFVVFSLFNIAVGLSARSETGTVFTMDTVADQQQLKLYGLALLFVLLPVEFGIGDRILGTVPMSGQQWLVCLAFAFALILIDEVVKFFMRRARSSREKADVTKAVSQTA